MFFSIKGKSKPGDDENHAESEDCFHLAARTTAGGKKKSTKKTTKKKGARQTSKKKSASKKKSPRQGRKRKQAGAKKKAARSKRPAAQRSRSSRRKRTLKRLAWMGALTVVAGGSLIVICGALYFDHKASFFDMSKVGSMPRESVVYDWRGNEIGRLQSNDRIVVPLSKVSPFFVDALMAREDKRFYEHGGIDYFGVARAALRNLKDRDVVQGASTLTMQLARNSFELRERSLRRKFLEMAIARRIEATYSKDEILAFYVNRIFLGSGVYGVERAADSYFGKPAAKLNLGESAMLAGIIRAPNRFSPFRHYKAALGERDMVLERMLAEGMISAGEKDKAERTVVQVRQQKYGLAWKTKMDVKRQLVSEGVMAAVRRELRAIMEKTELEDGGLEIYTTFDTDLQKATEQSVETRLRAIERSPGYPHQTLVQFESRRAKHSKEQPDYLQAAVVMIDNQSGAVLAMVGGRNYQHSQYNRAMVGKRTVGSVFKPLVYAAAFESGTFPGTLISDNPIQSGEIKWNPGSWSPRNSDGKYLGLQKAELGLISSRNTMSVRIGERAGIDMVKEMAVHAGLAGGEDGDAVEQSPQLYIGNMSATLEALTSAYSVFPNRGYRLRPYLIERIQGKRNDVVYENRRVGYRVLSAESAWMTSRILEKVMGEGGTGSSARDLGFTAPCGGKTGTTNDYQDAWFLGYSNRLTGGVWVGLDQPQKIIDHGYGSRLALPIWVDAMKVAAELEDFRPGPLPQAMDVMQVELCHISGKLVNQGCRQRRVAYREKVPDSLIPRSVCDVHRSGTPQQQGKPSGPSFFTKLKGIFTRK